MTDLIEHDVLIVGGGGAGLRAAIAIAETDPSLSIAVVSKIYPMRSHTVSAEGGAAAVIRPEDSLEDHIYDTISGADWLADQDAVEAFVNEAPREMTQLEHWGCPWSRNPDGTVHQKPFAGQSHDRTVHKGDLTGIEIINRLSEQVAAAGPTILEETRAVELLLDASGQRVTGVLLLDLRRGTFLVVQAKATLLATGGGPTMYKITAASHDKACDGIAMGFRAEC